MPAETYQRKANSTMTAPSRRAKTMGQLLMQTYLLHRTRQKAVVSCSGLGCNTMLTSSSAFWKLCLVRVPHAKTKYLRTSTLLCTINGQQVTFRGQLCWTTCTSKSPAPSRANTRSKQPLKHFYGLTFLHFCCCRFCSYFQTATAGFQLPLRLRLLPFPVTTTCHFLTATKGLLLS